MQAANLIYDERLTGLAHRMADAAGEILRRHWRTSITVEQKSDASPVTLADREVEETLRSMIESHYPQHGIIGEEFGNVRTQSDYQWVLDPIDGTRSFIGGYPLFTTLIGLSYRGTPVMGVIDQPILRERWIGMAGKPTLLNGRPVSARQGHSLATSVLASTSIDYFTPEQLGLFMQLRKRCAHAVLGGDAYAYAMLATGQNDIVIDAGLKPYDFCALRPVLEGAGVIFTGWKGESVTLEADGCILAAANPLLHKECLALLNL